MDTQSKNPGKALPGFSLSLYGGTRPRLVVIITVV